MSQLLFTLLMLLVCVKSQIIIVPNIPCTDYGSEDVCIKMVSKKNPCVWCPTANVCLSYDVCTNETVGTNIPSSCTNENLVFGKNIPTCFDITYTDVKLLIIIGYSLCFIVIVALLIILTMKIRSLKDVCSENDSNLSREISSFLLTLGFTVVYIIGTIYSLSYYITWLDTHNDSDFNKCYVTLFLMTFGPLIFITCLASFAAVCTFLYCCMGECLHTSLRLTIVATKTTLGCCGYVIVRCFKIPFLWVVHKISICKKPPPNVDFDKLFDDEIL